jgi:hypothetical protein
MKIEGCQASLCSFMSASISEPSWAGDLTTLILALSRALILEGASPFPSGEQITLDNGASVTHPAFGRGCDPRDEAEDGLLLGVVLLDPLSGHLLSLPPDLPDHDNALGLRVDHESLEDINEIGAIEGVSSNADDCGLAQPCAGALVDCLVGQGAGPGHDADLAGLVDVARHDADLALVGLDDAGAVGPDHAAGLLGAQHVLDPHHVVLGDAVRDDHHQLDLRLDGLDDGAGRAGGRHVDH